MSWVSAKWKIARIIYCFRRWRQDPDNSAASRTVLSTIHWSRAPRSVFLNRRRHSSKAIASKVMMSFVRRVLGNLDCQTAVGFDFWPRCPPIPMVVEASDQTSYRCLSLFKSSIPSQSRSTSLHHRRSKVAKCGMRRRCGRCKLVAAS